MTTKHTFCKNFTTQAYLTFRSVVSMAEPTSPPRFMIRPATKSDVAAMTEVFFRSFNAPFWQHFIPDKPEFRRWWDESWTRGLDNPTDRTFVAVDIQAEGREKVVAFSRWQVPQEDGTFKHDESWAKIVPEMWDMEIGEGFFGGMDSNREKLMGKRPHWFLDMLGTHEDYQGQGLAASLIKWGTDQADRDGLETMLHGSEAGQPYYVKRHNFEYVPLGDIHIPKRPSYGSFDYKTLIRPPQKTR